MKAAMTTYKVVCRVCGVRIHFVQRRNAWVHDRRGVDHAPVPGMPS